MARPPKSRNMGTMTEAAFWSMLRSHLRRLSLRWKPRAECLKRARRTYKGPNKRQKWEYQCCICKAWYSGKEVEADHIVSCGSLKSFEDLAVFTERLLVEVDGWQCICKTCHNVKTHSR